MHNTQPWRFRVRPDALELYADPARKLRIDPLGREMLISCGAALFGLRLGIRSLGFLPVVELLPDAAPLALLARVSLGEPQPMNGSERRMLEALPHRHTHRGPFTAEPLPAWPAGQPAARRGRRGGDAGPDRPRPRLRAAHRHRRGRLAGGSTSSPGPGPTCGTGLAARGRATVTACRPVPSPGQRITTVAACRSEISTSAGMWASWPRAAGPGRHRAGSHARRQPRRLALRRAGAAPGAGSCRRPVGVRQPAYATAGGQRDPQPDPGPAGAARSPADHPAAGLRADHAGHRAQATVGSDRSLSQAVPPTKLPAGRGPVARWRPASGLAGWASGQQPHLSCALDRRGTILSLELRVDVADVSVDGVHRDR